MRIIELNAANWNTTDDFYSALLRSIRAPVWHGRNLNALADSMTWGEINAAEPPSMVRIFGTAKLPKDTQEEIKMAKRALAEVGIDFRALRGRDAGVSIETDS